MILLPTYVINSGPLPALNPFNLGLRRYDSWQLREKARDLDLTSTSQRRLLYLSDSPKFIGRYLTFERENVDERVPEENQDLRWYGEQGQACSVDLLVPSG